jgi:hypothetical protein
MAYISFLLQRSTVAEESDTCSSLARTTKHTVSARRVTASRCGHVAMLEGGFELRSPSRTARLRGHAADVWAMPAAS